MADGFGVVIPNRASFSIGDVDLVLEQFGKLWIFFVHGQISGKRLHFSGYAKLRL
jgi:hypothetical protein